MHKFRYRVGKSEQDFEIETYTYTEEGEPTWLAEMAAEDYHDEHDGWEHRWPIEVHLFKDDKPLGTFTVHMEAQPVFSACRR